MNTQFARWLWVCLGAVLLARPGLSAPEPAEYMAIYHDGVKVGYTEERRTLEGPNVRCFYLSGLNTKPGGFRKETLETTDGHPLSAKYEDLKGPLTNEITISLGQMQIRRNLNGLETRETLPWPEQAVLPAGEALVMKSKGLSPGTTYSLVGFDIRQIKGVAVKVEVGPMEEVRILDHVEKLHRITLTEDERIVTAYVTDDFRWRKIMRDWMGLPLECVSCDKDLALSFNAVLEAPSRSRLRLPADIADCRNANALRLVIEPVGRSALPIPATGAQSVARRADGGYEVVVREVGRPPATHIPYDGHDPELRAALEPTVSYPSRDGQIMSAARAVVGDCQDADRACKLLEAWVHTNVHYQERCDDQTATAILANRHGMCRQKSILLLTLCRALAAR